MKATNHFINTIQTYLEQRAASDPLFEWKYTNSPNKSIDECITYILGEVQKSGCLGFHDDEIFGMAVHFYDEIDIKVGKRNNAHVVVNHVIELTEEEKEQARKDAIQKAVSESYNKLTKAKPKAKKITMNNQPSLFDF